MKKKNEITVFFGGKDNGSISFLVVKELIKYSNKKINVLLSGFNKPNKKLIELSNENKSVNLIHNKFSNSVLKNSSIYIGSSGVTAYEAFMCKIPGIIYVKSKNQTLNSKELKKNGFTVLNQFIPKKFAEEAYKLFKKKKKYNITLHMAQIKL